MTTRKEQGRKKIEAIFSLLFPEISEENKTIASGLVIDVIEMMHEVDYERYVITYKHMYLKNPTDYHQQVDIEKVEVEAVDSEHAIDIFNEMFCQHNTMDDYKKVVDVNKL